MLELAAVGAVGVSAIFAAYCGYRLRRVERRSGTAHSEELAALHLRTIEALAMAIEAKDQITHAHLQRVRIYAEEIGKELRLSDDEMKAVSAASLLHDIGKLAVPEHILGKPGRLTKEEFEKVKVHPTVGAEILERVRFPYPVVPIVRSHHEKWDGSGYPDGLCGEEIPIGARIISAVDCLDALASDRQYRRALPLEQALAHVVKEAGRSFDPEIVEVLKRRSVELEEKARQGAAAARLEHPPVETRVERGLAPDAGLAEPEPSAQEPVWASIASARREAQFFFDVTRELGSSLCLDDTLTVAANRLQQQIPFDALAVYLREADTLSASHVSGVECDLFGGLRIPVGAGLSGWVAEKGTPIVNGNPAVELGSLGPERAFSTLRSTLAVPLQGEAGVIGVIALYHRQPTAFSEEHLRIVSAISSRVGVAAENAMRFREAQQSASEDFLTGLPNSRAMFERVEHELARAKRQGIPVALAVCDLNEFKQINDSHGHAEGNRVLKAVADTLVAQCREYDLVARMGGDEFVLALPGLDADMAIERVDQLKTSIKGLAENLSISIGLALFPFDGENTADLLVEADTRMYADKEAGRRNRRRSTRTSSVELDA